MSITRDEVLWGYRMILGRDPESEEALIANMGSDDLYHLQKRFMGSEEFLLKRKTISPKALLRRTVPCLLFRR